MADLRYPLGRQTLWAVWCHGEGWCPATGEVETFAEWRLAEESMRAWQAENPSSVYDTRVLVRGDDHAVPTEGDPRLSRRTLWANKGGVGFVETVLIRNDVVTHKEVDSPTIQSRYREWSVSDPAAAARIPRLGDSGCMRTQSLESFLRTYEFVSMGPGRAPWLTGF